MANYNAENERIKRRYFCWLKEAKQCSEATVDATAKALSRFEECNRYKPFQAFHTAQAVAFKRHLEEQTGQRSGERLSKATQRATLTQLRQFFFWLADQSGFKSRLKHSDSDYFKLSNKNERIARAYTLRRIPTLEQVRHVIDVIPRETDLERRDRALIAFTLVTGARDGAIATLKMKHVDLAGRFVYQDPHEVKTKFSKPITTYFLPVGAEVIEAFESWVRYLKEDRLWGNDDPLFPATRIALGETRQFESCGLERSHWKTTTPIRAIFREAFERAGLPYFHPHSFRHTLVGLGERLCRTPEEFKAWSQNLGHENVRTTFDSYGSVTSDRQGEIIRGFATPQASSQTQTESVLRSLLERIRSEGM